MEINIDKEMEWFTKDTAKQISRFEAIAQRRKDKQVAKREGFEAAFESFFTGCKAITDKANDYVRYPHNLTPSVWRVDWLQKRARVVQGGSAHCFVDFATGDVLMPSSWKAPAKHARGNIFDESNGLKFMGPHGPAYLR